MDLERRVIETRPGRKGRTKRKYLIRDVAAADPVEPAAASDGKVDELPPTRDARFSKSRHEWIAEVAYYKAERRGFQGGDPDRDWHEAEREVEEWLRKDRPF